MTADLDIEYVVHIAGPMQQGIQRCALCTAVLTDETQLHVPPGATRYTRGVWVLVLDAEIRITGPLLDSRTPPGTRKCSDLPPSKD